MKMLTYTVWLVTGVLFAMAVPVQAELLRLEPQGEWHPAVTDVPEATHPGLAQVHAAMASADSDAVVTALEAIQRDYPELAGGDLDAFLAAERIYARKNLGKAGKLYKEFLDKWPDSLYQPAAMERYFSIGAAFLQGQKREFLGFLRLPAFDDGLTIMRTISDKSGNAPIALRALQVTAENQERRNAFIDAYHTWAEISVRWPTGAEGRDALLRMGRALHASYDGPDYDVAVLHGAQSYFEDYILRYPQIAEELNLAATLNQITEQLAHKHYDVGLYYERAGNTEIADRYYREVMGRWPHTSAAQMAALRLAPDADPAIAKTFRRQMFNASTGFLDSWFGVGMIFDGDTEAVEQ